MTEAGWKAFFDELRSVWKFIEPESVEPTKRLVEAAYAMGLLRNQTAYCIGTGLWETNYKMRPVAENLYYTTARRVREVWPSRFPTDASAEPFLRDPRKLANKVYNGRMGNQPGTDDGYNYRGRGFVQITGRDMYERASLELGIDFVADPSLALRLDNAIQIMLLGMRDGWFRPPHRLDKYITLQHSAFRDARSIVNADRGANGAKVARLAWSADRALRAMEQVSGAPSPLPAPKPPGDGWRETMWNYLIYKLIRPQWKMVAAFVGSMIMQGLVFLTGRSVPSEVEDYILTGMTVILPALFVYFFPKNKEEHEL